MVKEEIDIELISTEQLVKEAQKLRELQRIANEADKTKKQLASGRAPINFGFDSTPGNLPKDFFTSENQTRLGAIRGAGTQNAFNELVRQQKENLRKIEQLEKKQLDFVQKLTGTELSLQGIISAPGNLAGFANAGPAAKIFGLVGRFGVIGSIIAGMGSLLYDSILDSFKRGGVFDRTLKRDPQSYSLIDLEELNAYRSGTKYITSDLRVVQKAPDNSNTANIKYEAIRYTLDNLGR